MTRLRSGKASPSDRWTRSRIDRRRLLFPTGLLRVSEFTTGTLRHGAGHLSRVRRGATKSCRQAQPSFDRQPKPCSGKDQIDIRNPVSQSVTEVELLDSSPCLRGKSENLSRRSPAEISRAKPQKSQSSLLPHTRVHYTRDTAFSHIPTTGLPRLHGHGQADRHPNRQRRDFL